MVQRASLSVMAALALAFAPLQGAEVSRQQADSFLQKVTLIDEQGAAPADVSRTPRRTSVSESEINSWFALDAPDLLPAGVTQPRIAIAANRTITGVATVDLDTVARSRSTGGFFDVWSLVGGRMPVTVRGILHARGGRGRFELLEAAVSGVPVPRRIVEELVDYYSRTPERPDGVRLDQEFDLPSGIQRIDLEPGVAVVVQ